MRCLEYLWFFPYIICYLFFQSWLIVFSPYLLLLGVFSFENPYRSGCKFSDTPPCMLSTHHNRAYRIFLLFVRFLALQQMNRGLCCQLSFANIFLFWPTPEIISGDIVNIPVLFFTVYCLIWENLVYEGVIGSFTSSVCSLFLFLGFTFDSPFIFCHLGLKLL